MPNQGGGKGNDPKKKGAGNFNEMILGGLKSRAGKETVRWVKGLASDAEELVMASVEKRDAGPAPDSPIAWVDKLFDLFQQYEVELNRVTGDQPELRLGTERPVFTESLLVRLQNNPNAEFTGRVHTREWTLAITGNIERIEGHIIPSAHLIAFSANESNFSRYFEVRPVAHEDGMAWACEGGLVTWDKLPVFAKQIIGGLFHVSRGEVSENEPFIFNPDGLEAIRLSKKGEPEVTHPLFMGYNDPGPLLSGDSSISGSSRPELLDQAETIPPKSRKQANAQPQPQTQPQLQQQQTQPPAEQRRAEPAGQTAAPTSRNPAQSAGAINPDASGECTLSAACDMLLKAVDKELENLSRAGAKAFESHDFIAVEQTLKKSTRIKHLREQIQSTVGEWQRVLSDDN